MIKLTSPHLLMEITFLKKKKKEKKNAKQKLVYPGKSYMFTGITTASAQCRMYSFETCAFI